MLKNLKAIYSRAEDQRRALAAAERIQLLSPGAWENLGDLARLQTETGNYPAATESLVRYLELAPPDEDTGAFEAALKAIEDGQPDNNADLT
jgi:regulator of sirC expression with transglutaminase-like and TPR domain